MTETTPTAAQEAATARALLEKQMAQRATMTSTRAADCAALEAIAEQAEAGHTVDDQRSNGDDHAHADNVSDAEEWAARYPASFREAVQEFVAEFGADSLDLENETDPVGRLEDCARYWVQSDAWHRMAQAVEEATTNDQENDR